MSKQSSVISSEPAQSMSDLDASTVTSTFDPKTVAISYEEIDKLGLKTKSQIIRHLDSVGYSKSAIAKFLNIRYQHVRNVLTQTLKRPIKAERDAAKAAAETAVNQMEANANIEMEDGEISFDAFESPTNKEIGLPAKAKKAKKGRK